MDASTTVAREITMDFYGRGFDLSLRPGAPTISWQAMPEVAVSEVMERAGATSAEVRLLLTFTAAMDRARDADRLWGASGAMFASREDRWVFIPEHVIEAPLLSLADTLRRFGVSQRHLPDAAAWRVLGETLASADLAPNARRAIFEGVGDARDLLGELSTTTPGGSSLFPFLRGPKVGPMWIRMLGQPGGALISGMEAIPVAVDVQVRRVSEHLGVADTSSLDLDSARPLIQTAWNEDVARGGTAGPPGLENTAAALDPALWFMGKWGCSFCEQRGAPSPITDACRLCNLAS